MSKLNICLYVLIGFFLFLSNSYAYIPGTIYGIVQTANSNEPISNVVIKTNAGRTAISFSDGTFIIDHEEGEYTLTVIADDYKPYTDIIVVQTFKTIERNIILTPETPDDNFPVIESVSTEQILNGEKTAIIRANNISSTYLIEKVEGIIIYPKNPQKLSSTPASDYPVLPFYSIIGTNDYSATYQNFLTIGTYKVVVKAVDIFGNESLPLTATVKQTTGLDIFEQDNTINNAKSVVINATNAQRHTFHNYGDEDWIKFYGIVGKSYRIEISKLENQSKPVMELYGPDKKMKFSYDLFGSLINGKSRRDYLIRRNEGVYYICIKNNDPDLFGANTGYDLRVGYPEGSGFPGTIFGSILDEFGNRLDDVVVKTNFGRSCISNDGDYIIDHEIVNNCLITFKSPCSFNKENVVKNLKELKSIKLNMIMKKVKLSDAIKSLQIISGFSTDMDKFYYDNEIGLDDTIRILNCFE